MLELQDMTIDQGFTLSVNGQKVKKADKVKFLEVIIDENLTWDDFINHYFIQYNLRPEDVVGRRN